MAASAARAVKAAAGKDAFIVRLRRHPRPACRASSSDTVRHTVAQDPFGMGYKAVEAAVKAAKGEEVEDFIDTGSTVITEERRRVPGKLEEQLAGA